MTGSRHRRRRPEPLVPPASEGSPGTPSRSSSGAADPTSSRPAPTARPDGQGRAPTPSAGRSASRRDRPGRDAPADAAADTAAGAARDDVVAAAVEAPLPSTARGVAVLALARIDAEGAYANLVLPSMLSRGKLSDPDRRFTTELVYGTTRMRRAVDAMIDPYLVREPDVLTRAALRVGAYQLLFLGTPPHAAVGETVEVVGGRTRGLVNAVLRRIAARSPEWADPADRLSYPDWVVDRLVTDLGSVDALAALEAMNMPASATERADGYIQDRGSQWVADLVGAGPGERVVDVCAAPGGKATAMAGSGATVLAVDLRPGRVRLLAANRDRLGLPSMHVVCADARRLPLAPGSADRVLVDAPCTGLGSLRRRPDARWRIDDEGIERLVRLQRSLVEAALSVLRPGGLLVYSVCTLTAAETIGIDEWLAERHPGLTPEPPPPAPWCPWGRGALLLPQAADTDGMFILRLRSGLRPGAA